MLVNRYINFIANAFLHNPFPYIAHGASKHNARTQQHRTRIPSPLPHHLPEQHVLAFPVAWEVGGGQNKIGTRQRSGNFNAVDVLLMTHGVVCHNLITSSLRPLRVWRGMAPSMCNRHQVQARHNVRSKLPYRPSDIDELLSPLRCNTFSFPTLGISKIG